MSDNGSTVHPLRHRKIIYRCQDPEEDERYLYSSSEDIPIVTRCVSVCSTRMTTMKPLVVSTVDSGVKWTWETSMDILLMATLTVIKFMLRNPTI